MRSIQFVGFAFDDPSGGAASGVRASDLERLLGSVLPAHPTLKQIRFVRCNMSDAHWGLFVRSLPTTTATTTGTGRVPPHKHLSVAGCVLDVALVRPLAEMVRRNVLLSGLALSNSGERMDPYVCQLLCSGMSRNAHLQDLSIDVTDVLPGTMDGATGPASPVRSLYIRGRISPNAVAPLANQLKTNSRLTSLILSSHQCADGDGDPTYRRADERYPDPARSFDGQRSIEQYLRRNRWIQNALLPHLVNYRVHSPRLLWPILLERVSEVPTLLYRFLRRGNLEGLCAVVAVRRNPKHHKNAGRTIDTKSRAAETRRPVY
jgi:hypothetical protein